jgi:transcriptional regulator with XRE-family HTH domain
MTKSPHLLLQFGQRVRTLRQARHLSQEALADLCLLDRTYISSLERGQRNVGLENIARLAQALEVSLAEFFEGITVDEFDSE